MLFEQIKKDQLTARKNKESEKALWLSTLIGELQRGEKDFSDVKVLGLIKKNLDNLRENLKHHPDSEAVKNEISFLESYLPKQLNDDELKAVIQKLIAEGATNMKLVMTGLQTQYTGLYDGKKASGFVKDALGM